MEKIVETERLSLRIIDKSYAELVLNYYLRNRSFLEEWEALRSEDFYMKENHEKQLNDDLVNIEKGSLARFWLFKKGDDNKIIGSIGFSNIVRGVFLSCHLGYKLDE